MTDRAVILVGGKGTRLAPYTAVLPKPLMPLGDTTILEVVLRQLANRGFDEAVLAVGHMAGLIEAFVGAGEKAGIAVRYSTETEPLGTAGPLSLVTGLDEPFLTMNGDVLTTLDYAGFLRAHRESDAEMTIAAVSRQNVVDFGIVESDAEGRLTGYIEKPVSAFRVSMGVNAISPSALDALAPGERADIPDLARRLVAAGRVVRVWPFDGYWLDIGRHDDFATAQAEFENRKAELLGDSLG